MIQIINNINDFYSIKDECNSLADNFKMPLLRFEWLFNCATIFCPPAKLNIFLLRDNKNEIKAIAPLVLIKNYVTEKLEIIGTSIHKEPGGFLYKNEESLVELLDEIIKSEIPIYLKGIRLISSEASAIFSILKKYNAYTFKRNELIPYLSITESWEEFQKNISSSRRSSLKRLYKIASELGKVEFEIFCPTKENVDSYLDEIFSVEASGWKSRIGSAMKLNSNLGQFFRSYSKDSTELGLLRLAFLRLNGEAIAVQIGLEYAKRFWSLKIGYNENWSKCSPGILLMNYVIRYAFENKLEAVELLGSDEPWLHIWTSLHRELITYKIYPTSFSKSFDLMKEFSNSFYKRAHFFISKKIILSNAK